MPSRPWRFEDHLQLIARPQPVRARGRRRIRRLPLSRGPAACCGAGAFSVWLWRAASFRLGPEPPQPGSMEQPRPSFGSGVLGSCAKWVHGGGVGLPFWQPRLSIGRPGCAHAARRRP
jgi:hypothetical protein